MDDSMSGTTSEYMVKRFGGAAMPNDDALVAWLNERGAEGWQLVTVDASVGYFVRSAAPAPEPPPVAPTNVTVPYVGQTGDVLNCTMGTWTGEPTAYAYQWRIDGANVGTDSPNYTATTANVGNTATCVVTATNAAGSTAAPPSNGVVVSGLVRAQ
jgi:hypothetical protein